MTPDHYSSLRINFHHRYLRAIIHRIGVVRTTAALSIVAFVLCSAIMIPINLITHGSLFTGFVVTLVVCTTFVPWHTYELGRLLSELEHVTNALYATSITDELTKAYNRRYFLSALSAAIPEHRSSRRPLAVLLLDIDHFKQINDTYGHDAGDVVLQGFVALCQAHLRLGDLLARYGGEEFICLLPDTTAEQAQAVAERLRAIAAQTPIPHGQQAISLTVSIGVKATPVIEQQIPDSFLLAADHALYQAKRAGRNTVIFAGER